MEGFEKLNKAFESRVRLGVMSLLLVDDWVSYSDLKDKLQLTDGNLASHTSALEKLGYIQVNKQFVGKKPLTTYAVTPLGRKAFRDHLDGLEAFLKS